MTWSHRSMKLTHSQTMVSISSSHCSAFIQARTAFGAVLDNW
jgi:hypothetical protein